MDKRVKIKACAPCGIRNDVKEFYVNSEFNGSPSSGVFKETELTKDMRLVLHDWFIDKFYQLPKDLQKKIKKEI